MNILPNLMISYEYNAVFSFRCFAFQHSFWFAAYFWSRTANSLTKNIFTLILFCEKKKNFIILCRCRPIKFWTSLTKTWQKLFLFLWDARTKKGRVLSLGWQWCCRLFNANSMKAVSMSTWSTLLSVSSLQSLVSNSRIAGSRFQVLCMYCTEKAPHTLLSA